MYESPETVLEKYDIEVTGITKGRGVYLCESGEGTRVLVPFKGSAERAECIKDLMQLLVKNGYEAESICLTAEGKASAEDPFGSRYWLKEYISGSECSTKQEAQIFEALKELARFHAVSRAVIEEVPELLVRRRSEPDRLYERHARELIKVKNYIHSRHTHNELERIFMEQYPYYSKQAQEALGRIKNLRGEDSRTLCHGAFNQHNVKNTGQGMRIINFETVCWNEPVLDLENFIRKIMEKNDWSTELGSAMIESYTSVRRMSQREWELLLCILLFPEKFWKIANHYCSSHKVRIFERDIEKYRRLAKAEAKRARFLEKLFLFRQI